MIQNKVTYDIHSFISLELTVFPDPVCPYAITVTLYPSKDDVTNVDNSSKRSDCVDDGGKTRSKLKGKAKEKGREDNRNNNT